MIEIISWFFIFVSIFWGYMFFRTLYVGRFKIRILMDPTKNIVEQLKEDGRYPSIDEMLFKFWVLDLKKFRKPESAWHEDK